MSWRTPSVSSVDPNTSFQVSLWRMENQDGAIHFSEVQSNLTSALGFLCSYSMSGPQSLQPSNVDFCWGILTHIISEDLQIKARSLNSAAICFEITDIHALDFRSCSLFPANTRLFSTAHSSGLCQTLFWRIHETRSHFLWDIILWVNKPYSYPVIFSPFTSAYITLHNSINLSYSISFFFFILTRWAWLSIL